MTYHSQLNLIMLATVIGLAVFLYLTPQFQSSTDAEYQISLRAPETVQVIRIIRNGQEAVLRRIAGNWHLMEPFSARADEALVAKILHVLSAHSRQRFPLENTESFGLEHPHIELYIDNDYFAFGDLAPVTNEQYLAINEHVYLVSPRYAVWMPVNPLDLISPKLLADNEIPVKFELDYLSIQLRDGIWRMDSGKMDGQPREFLERWVETWRFSQATELTRDLLDHSRGFSNVKISLQDERVINYTVLENVAGTVFLRADEQVGYLFPEDTGRRLLNPFIVETD